MKNEIYEKLNSIDNLNDRLLLKKVINSLFTSLQEYTEEKYINLEERVFKEVHYNGENYNIFCTISKRQDIDPTNQFLFPIVEKDIEKEVYDIKHIIKNLADKKEIVMFKIFLKCDYLLCKHIMAEKKIFEGLIETNKGNYRAYFSLNKNMDYWDKVIELYKSFINNNIPWSTINNPYISKIANVVLVQCEGSIKEDEIINKISIDFGEYSKYIEYDMVPLWNIKKRTLKSTGFPAPCKDYVHYEHNIALQKEGVEHGYLVEYDSIDIQYIVHTEDSLVISASTEEAQRWQVWKIISQDKAEFENYSYELMSNAKNKSFAGDLALKNKNAIRTKAELIRIINSFKVSKKLQFCYLKLEDIEKFTDIETYDANYFLEDEIREDNIKKTLILYFKLSEEMNYLTRDILSFLVSEIQLLYPEYKCEGRLI